MSSADFFCYTSFFDSINVNLMVIFMFLEEMYVTANRLLRLFNKTKLRMQIYIAHGGTLLIRAGKISVERTSVC